ncbi:MAG: hypothetical protein NTW87_36270, partial [Planctomycetota bacterium]|nr:hypothetical protein [Planctomycetota bacterium]
MANFTEDGPVRIRFALAAVTCLIAACAGRGAVPSHPTPTQRHQPFRSLCAAGLAPENTLTERLALDRPAAHALVAVPEALRTLGYRVELVNRLGIWVTDARWEWPAGPAAGRWRATPHPGVSLWLLLVARTRTAAVLIVEADAICAPAPGTSDSVLVAARTLAIRELV